ncbi:hypothetical protein EmuJ_000215600 [Echinococcus multilocularis]|uniref:Uncharacterized protein n=1 Tax=Echinococcus multilocularis TaxID=6211 RepID=A0A087W0W4_ECHMU|nr:hypothetical protein EmuJ_000215600 [Echinococcus multilocularis]
MLSVNVFVTFTLFSNILQYTQGWPFPRSETYTNKICRCIDSLAQTVKFYGNKYRSLTIDSLLGLAILRDSIGYICRTELLPPYIIKRVCKLSALINNSFDAMSDYILSHKLGFLSMLEWKANTYTGNTMYVSESPTIISLAQNENCLAELANGTKAGCVISKICEEMFFGGIHRNLLTRQVFYYQAFLRVSDCRTRNLTRMDVYQISETLCYSVLSEFELNYPRRNFSTHIRSLLMEQNFLCYSCPLLSVVYCGLGGYFQLAHPTLMEEIISWQDSSGCFKAVNAKENGQESEENPKMDRPLKDGCLPHLTSMAANALAMHLYRFATEVVFVPDFHSILLMETILLDNTRNLPDFVILGPSPTMSPQPKDRPYASVPDTVL